MDLLIPIEGKEKVWGKIVDERRANEHLLLSVRPGSPLAIGISKPNPEI